MQRSTRLAAVAALLLIGMLCVSAGVALAHAQYASSNPASNATLQAAPTSITVTYTEELASIQIAVTGPHGSDVTTSKAAIDLAHRTNASVGVANDGPGVYTVVWHNVSGDDGDPNDGAFSYTVAGTAPAAPVTVAPAATAALSPSAASSAASSVQPSTMAPACNDNGQVTPGINDVRVNTYCKRQAIRDKYKGQIDENTFNFDLADGVGLEHALEDAMAANVKH